MGQGWDSNLWLAQFKSEARRHPGGTMNAREQLGKRLIITEKAAARLRKYLKKTTRRIERREAKRFLDDAPPRHWKGYAD